MGVEARILRWLVWAVALLSACGLVFALRNVLSPIFFAFMLAYVLDPLVDRFEAAKIPRSVGIVVLLVVVLGVLGLFVVLVVPTIVADVVNITRQFPATFASWMGVLQETARGWGVGLPASWSDVMARFGGDLSTLAQSALLPLGSVMQQVVGGTASMLSTLSALVMVPVFSFYLLHDFDVIVARMGELVPPRLRTPVGAIAREIDTVLSQFMRGQVTVMAILAVLYAGAYSLVGVSLAVPIGIVAGLLSFIPYVGGASALVLALLMVALHWVGWGQVIAVVAAYIVIQLLEGFVITPRIVGDKLGLSPVWVLFAMLAGAELFGFVGILLSLPAAAVVKVFVLRGLALYKASAFFGAEAVAGASDMSALLVPLADASAAPDATPGATPDATPALETAKLPSAETSASPKS